MKHIGSFHGSISALLLAKGLDSKLVLEACNAYRGSIEASKSKSKIVSETKMVGKITEKADNRKLTFSDKERYQAETAKGEVPAPGQLIALSDALHKVNDTYGATITLTEFGAEVEGWLHVKRNVYAIKVPAPASAQEPAPAPAS